MRCVRQALPILKEPLGALVASFPLQQVKWVSSRSRGSFVAKTDFVMLALLRGGVSQRFGLQMPGGPSLSDDAL